MTGYFIANAHRLNVALSRGRAGLYILGSRKHLDRSQTGGQQTAYPAIKAMLRGIGRPRCVRVPACLREALTPEEQPDLTVQEEPATTTSVPILW